MFPTTEALAFLSFARHVHNLTNANPVNVQNSARPVERLHCVVRLILGTSPISTWDERRNYYFDHRIETGADHYKAGKVD